VLVALCHSDHSAKCEHAYYRDRIKPGGVESENISPDVRTEWAVANPHGRLLRCVVLYWKYWPGHDVNVRLTAAPRWAWPCSRTTRASPRWRGPASSRPSVRRGRRVSGRKKPGVLRSRIPQDQEL